jgi:putative methyltransferase (TIGR04325 family)
MFELIIQIIRQLTPPILFNIPKRFFRKSGMEEFESYDDALIKCSSMGYENSDVVEVVFEKTLAFNTKFESDSVFDLSTMRVMSALGLSGRVGSLKVIDFGGASGHHFDIAVKAYENRLDLRWNVVETTAMVNLARKRKSKNLNFFDNIMEAQIDLGQVDLVFSSGTLHCCPDPLSLLKELVNVNAKYIFITRTALAEREYSTVVVQKSYLSTNGPGPLQPGVSDAPVYYPVVVVSKKSFEDVLSERYDIKFGIVEEAAIYRVKAGSINLYGYYCIRRD